MTNIEFETMELIPLIESRPAIWDLRIEDYKNKKLRTEAWQEICKELKSEYKTLSEEQQVLFCKDVMKRWVHIRDSYMKSRKQKHIRQTAGKKCKNYIYENKLKFLSPFFNPRKFSNQIDEEKDTTSSFFQEVVNISPATNAKTSTVGERRKRKISKSLEFPTLKNLEDDNVNRHSAFFQSVMPSLQNFNEEQTMDFQMGVLQLISNIKHRRNEMSTQQRSIQVQSSLNFYPNPNPLINLQPSGSGQIFTSHPCVNINYGPSFTQTPIHSCTSTSTNLTSNIKSEKTDWIDFSEI